MSPLLFLPIQLGGITLPNRVLIVLCRRLLVRCGIRLLRRSTSESATLCPGDWSHEEATALPVGVNVGYAPAWVRHGKAQEPEIATE